MRFNRTIVAIAMCALFAIIPTLSACADNDTPITVDKLPVQAQTFLKTYFGDKRVAYATKDRDLMTVTYEVKYMEGAKEEFRKDGEWKDEWTEVVVKFGHSDGCIGGAWHGKASGSGRL